MADEKDALAKIAEHRAKIDELDQQIVRLINERAMQSLLIRELKPEARMGLYDPRREEEILERIRTYNDGPLYNEHLREIYHTILKVMKEAPSL